MSILDWRELAPEQDFHDCDCSHCDLVGDLEPVEWPTLIVTDGDGADYVTDRFLMVPATLAPVPDGYEGSVITTRPDVSDLLASLAGVSNRRPFGLHFRWSILKALDLTGWDLRLLGGDHDTDKAQRVAVVNETGLPIGVAMSVSDSFRNDDERSPRFTREYEAVPA